ncbi:MAG: type II toxin-antitoxin system prevent-host-death family antitoxin [Acidobacteria bacterium]|nr:MAG: type II toxin-antitoxin system prevent-host-death family antitoxin [Acidobacteriota bacterium]
MEKATISQLKNRLSAYLRLVREGKTVVILDRNQPVARLEKVPDEIRPDARLARLESKGIVSRATKPLPLALLRTQVPQAKSSVLAALLDERREGR